MDVLLHQAEKRKVHSHRAATHSGGGAPSLRAQKHIFAKPSLSCGVLCCACCGKRAGNYLVLLYFLIKLTQIGNAAANIVLIQYFTATNYTFYGLELLTDVSRGYEWQKSGVFPRVTWCDFEVRHVGGPIRYSIMCGKLSSCNLYEYIF